MKFHMHVPGSQFLRRHIAAVESCAHEAVVPASGTAETGKLVLPHEDSGEAIRIHPRLTFFVVDLIELAECLTKWLPNACGKNTFAPLPNLRDVGRKWMPQPD